ASARQRSFAGNHETLLPVQPDGGNSPGTPQGNRRQAGNAREGRQGRHRTCRRRDRTGCPPAMTIWKILYNWFFIPFAWLTVRLYALVNHKAKSWLDGRADLFERLRSQASLLPHDSTRIWFHSSSLGEFE